MIIADSISADHFSNEFDWCLLEEPRYRFCTVQRVDYLYEPFMTMYVNSVESLLVAIRALEEEALMYIINELPREKPVEFQNLNPNNDMVVISKNTAFSVVDSLYAPGSLMCWKRSFGHDGDLYADVDVVLSPKSKLHHVLEVNPKLSIAVKIEVVSPSYTGVGAANISAAIVESDANNMGLDTMTVRLIKHDKKASTIDILLGMQ